MLNLRPTQTVTLEGAGGETYRFTFARFSSAGWQRYQMQRQVAKRYALDAVGYESAADTLIDQVLEKVRAGSSLNDKEAATFAIALDALAWSRIVNSLERIESSIDGATWQTEQIPVEWRDPAAFLSEMDRASVHTLDSAAIEINRDMLGVLGDDDEAKKKENGSGESSATALTNSPRVSTTTTTTSPKRPKRSSPSKSESAGKPKRNS